MFKALKYFNQYIFFTNIVRNYLKKFFFYHITSGASSSWFFKQTSRLSTSKPDPDGKLESVNLPKIIFFIFCLCLVGFVSNVLYVG